MGTVADEMGLTLEYIDVIEALPVETTSRGLVVDNSAANIVGVREVMDRAVGSRFVDERQINNRALINAAPTATRYVYDENGKESVIAGGWETNKASVIMAVSHTVPGMTIKTYIQGYTDELLIENNTLSEDTRIYFNKIYLVREAITNGEVYADLGAIFNTIYDPETERTYLDLDLDTSEHLCNPEFLRGAMDDIEALEEEVDDDEDITISIGAVSDRLVLHHGKFHSGVDMLTSIIASTLKNRNEDVSYDYTPTTRSLEFFKALYMLKGEFSPTYITVAELDELFGYRNVEEVTTIKLAKSDEIEFPYHCELEDNDTNSLEAQINYTLNNELMKVFSELGVTSISLRADNFDGVTEPRCVITDELDLSLVADGIDDTDIVQVIINYVESVIFPQISEGIYTLAVQVQYNENVSFITVRVEGISSRPVTIGFVNSTFIDSSYINNVVSSDRMIRNALATDTLLRS